MERLTPSQSLWWLREMIWPPGSSSGGSQGVREDSSGRPLPGGQSKYRFRELQRLGPHRSTVCLPQSPDTPSVRTATAPPTTPAPFKTAAREVSRPAEKTLWDGILVEDKTVVAGQFNTHSRMWNPTTRQEETRSSWRSLSWASTSRS